MSGTYKQSFKQAGTDHIDLSVFNCGKQSCEGGYTWGPGVRDHYLIHYIVSGKGVYTVDHMVYALQAGDVFLARPNQLISYSADLAEPWEYYWVGFHGAGASRLVLEMPFREDRPVHHCRNTERIQQALLDIFLARGPKPYCEAQMVGHLYLFAAELMRETAALAPHTAGSTAQHVFNAVKFIQFNYAHANDIARAAGVSRSHLYRAFISNMGRSPIDYLTQYRIDEACALLKSSALSIAEIAVSVGFFDPFYFSRVFKKNVGVPPSRYLAGLAHRAGETGDGEKENFDAAFKKQYRAAHH